MFHQIRFEEYPAIRFELYFELSQKVLSPSFMPPLESEYGWSYDQCLYFIDMASGVFAKKPEKFMVLWNMIKKQIEDKNGYLWDEWCPSAYARLIGDK